MFLPVVLIAALVPGPRVEASPQVHCPANSATTAGSYGNGAHERCAAVEVTGTAGSDGLTLDPAFSKLAAPTELDRSVPNGHVLLEGLTSDGRLLFAFPFEASGAFHLIVPIDARMERDLARLRLSENGQSTERAGDTGAITPDAEILDVDAGHVLVAWDGQRYPAIRVLDPRTGRVLATGLGSTTYTQVTVESSQPHILIEFSNGTRSVARDFRVFGR